MISTNDTSILAMLSRYPDMSEDEADTYIERIEHEENIPVCHAILGRIEPVELTDDARRTFMEFKRWSDDRTQRVAEEERAARYAEQETKRAKKMLELYDKGIISEKVLILYGISGDLPERRVYEELSDEQKYELWERRMARRFGVNWRRRFTTLPSFLCRLTESRECNWTREGF